MAKPKPTADETPSPTPTPAPASAAQPAGRRLSRQEAMERVAAEMDMEGLEEADRLYGGDDVRELEDIKAGRHPLQRDGKNLDAYEKYQAEVARLKAEFGD